MARASKNRRKRLGKKNNITLPNGYNGDHGTGTDAAIRGTLLVPVKDSPNRMARRTRVDAYTRIDLTTRQEQAAKAIRDAFCRVEMLSSGGPLKERVEASPRPDATIDMQIACQGRLHRVMSSVHRSDRPIIEHILWRNQPLRALKGYPRSGQRFKKALDLVADYLGY